ncbi:DNA ligase D [Cribrihabitans pelagius]|uniref:DNA ligase D n=1 Tax=Cribrihabitans pelagius TaxID=1765746 RepID=UPI003B595901
MPRAPDRLSEYNDRRDFSRTDEPMGRIAAAGGETRRFIVQKHAASRLHYDFRLEWDGVLLSWAVTKGPSPDPAEKRLAVRTEDHPLDYADFEGSIPKGDYGGGTVMLWDDGTWTPQEDVEQGLDKGKIKITLQGSRMQGGWTLIRMHQKKGGKRENWLLIKERDDYAQDDPDALTAGFTTSVKTGRKMEQIAENAAPAEPETSSVKRRGKRPAFVKPQLATLVGQAPAGDDWLHETKFDGYRCLAALGKGGARLYTRSGKDWTEKFGGLAAAFDRLPCDTALIDGEVMAARVEGSAFSSLQRALKEKGALVFFAFDLLRVDGGDLTVKGQLGRRERLAQLLSGQPPDGPLRMSSHVIGNGAQVFAAACEAKAEGIICKRIDAPYRGRRSKAWLKVKCTRRQEFVIVGYSPSDKKGRPFASLLMAANDGGELRYMGRVGTGFSETAMDQLAAAFTVRKTPPAENVPARIAGEAVWLRPELVAEVEFSEFTADGHIRHGAFLGLREDKDAGQVRMERAMAQNNEAEIGGIRITSAGRQVFPDAHCTKGDVARHYDRVGSRMVNLIGRRPLSLFRCPSGLGGQCFFQKHDNGGMPPELGRVEIEESGGNTETYLYATRAESLVAAAQMGTLEFHVWGVRQDRQDRPDRLVFDLDPDEGLDWSEVRAGAVTIRNALQELGLETGAIVTGGKGVHVWTALRRTRGWETVKLFAKTFAHLMAARHREQFTASMSKAKRRGRIFIDWLRNERGATSVAPYSLRARPGAPVAVPVTWGELQKLDAPNAFTIGDMAARMEAPCPALAVQENMQTLSNGVIRALERQVGED